MSVACLLLCCVLLQYAEYHNAEFLYVECNNAEYHNAESSYAEHLCTEWHYADLQ